MEQAQQLEENLRSCRVSLVLMDDEGMALLNQEYFGTSTPTDVISFLYDHMPGEPAGPSGEVIVNAERALAEGPGHGGCARELALYIAHGCHHLTGASDHTLALRARMRAVEERWLDEAEKQHVLRGIIEEAH